MAHPRRFRFGVQLNRPLPGLDWPDSARRIEELGYSSLLMPDHFADQLGPISAMTAAAAATRTLKVGTLVFDNDYRHPVVLAKEMATIDLLFEGRCEVGMGAGWKTSDYDTSGIPMDSPGVRVARLMEAVQIVRGLWGPEPVNFEGDHYRITDLVGLPVPSSDGGPPLIIAGGSPRMLRFAGANADIVGVNPSIHSGEVDAEAARDSLADRIDQKVAWVREGAGDRFDSLEINAWVPVVVITEDADSVAQMLAPGFGIDPENASDALESPMTMIGTVDEIGERLEERRARWGYSYHVVQDETALELAPVVAKFADA